MLNEVFLRVINLERRHDRRLECLVELNNINFSASSELFFAAKPMDCDGALGCALSHARVLTDFLYYSDLEFAMILEDDFHIVDTANFVSEINSMIIFRNEWDVLLLAHNQAVPVERTSANNWFRVYNAQTTAGYLVSRTFAPELVYYFLKSAEYLRQHQGLPAQTKKVVRHFVAADMLWKSLAVSDRFVASFPAQIVQRPSYSDVEGCIVDYGV